MQCPYCETEMVRGYLHHEIAFRPTWLPEDEKLVLGFSPVRGDPIGKFWSGKIFCHRCNECMKIVIDIEDKRNI